MVKWVFKRRRHAESLLRAVLPRAVRSLVAWGSLRIEDTDHVSAALRSRHGDLVLSLRLRGAQGRLFVLLEHQRKVQRWMILRAGDYMLRTWQKMRRPPRGTRLPPIVTVLLHNGARPWTAPVALQDLVHQPRLASEGEAEGAGAWLAQHVPHFKMHLVDLHGGGMAGVDPDALTPLCRLVLWCLSVAGDDGLLSRDIAAMAGPLNEVLRSSEAEDALEAVLLYLAATHPGLPAQRVRALIEGAVDRHGQEVIVTFLDEIKNEGKQEGLKQGREEGREEGRRALSLTLVALLERRFGPLPKKAEARVLAASEPALRRWALRVLAADSVEEVLRGTSAARRSDAPQSRPRARATTPRAPAARSSRRG